MAGGSAETAEFAARLRALKERSGSSYGTLAKRLHISTSTLHRYCQGAAVPASYAPVEQFARLCGATPQELIALHRLWVLAYAARARSAAPRSKTAASPAGRPDPESDSPPTPESVPRPVPARAPERTPEPIPEATPEPIPKPIPKPTPKPIPEPAPGTAPDTAPDTAPAGEPESAPGPRSARRRRRLLIGGAALASVLAVLAVTSWTMNGGTDGPNGSTDGQRSVRTAPSALASSPPALPPSPVSSASHVAATSAPASPSAGPGGEGRRDSSPPLSLAIRSHIWDSRCGHHYLLDRPPHQVPPPPVEQDAEGWAAAQGAVHGDTTNVEVTVRGRSAAPVVLQGLHVRVVQRRAPLPWSSFDMSSGCGGGLAPAGYDVNLDVPRPLAWPKDGGDDEGAVFPVARFPYQVTDAEPVVLLVRARTVVCDCAWYLELGWTSEGRSGTIRIDDAGRPFRTSTTKDRPRYVYAYGSASWIKP